MGRKGDISITPLMVQAMNVLVERIGEPLEGKTIAAEIAKNPAYPGVGSQTLTSPLRALRLLRLITRKKFQDGTRQVGHNEYPIIVRHYQATPGTDRLWPLLHAAMQGNGGGFVSEEQFREAKAEAAALSNSQHNEVNTIMDSPPTDEAEHATGEYVPHKEPFFSFSTIYPIDGGPKYMTRLTIGRLRLHIMWRGDEDACHDHPWDFWTFPLTSYVEEILVPTGGEVHYVADGTVRTFNPTFQRIQNIVRAGRVTFRPAEHRHRILGRYSGVIMLPGHEDDARLEYSAFKTDAGNASAMLRRGWTAKVDAKPIVTIVWRSPYKRNWGFWKNSAGKWCWEQYRKFFNGGKHAPCE